MAFDINCMMDFLARRDVPWLTVQDLKQHPFLSSGEGPPVDLLILLGGITSTAPIEMVARAFREGCARQLMVVGGIGHSTEGLRRHISRHPIYHVIPTQDRPESHIIADVLKMLKVRDVLVEDRSTNCGNNASLALRVLEEKKLAVPLSVLLVQDPTMQRRSHESFVHAWRGLRTSFLSFAACLPYVRDDSAGSVTFVDKSHNDQWTIERFVELCLGEIRRLNDDSAGYGPQGAGFLGHVDIPDTAFKAFVHIGREYAVREANPNFATCNVSDHSVVKLDKQLRHSPR